MTAACTERAVAVYSRGLRRGRPRLLARGGGAVEAAREHLPLGQHRARQRARPAHRPPRDRHLGGDRRRLHQAVRLHALRAGPGDGRPLPARSTPSTSPTRRASTTSTPSSSSWPARSTSPTRCSACARSRRALNDAGKAVNGSKVLILGVSYKAGVADLREAPALKIIRHLRELGAEVTYHDPLVPALEDAGPRVGRPRRRRRRGRRRRDRHRPRRDRLRGAGRAGARSSSTSAASPAASRPRTSSASELRP